MSCDAEDVTFLFRKFWLQNRAFRFLSRTFKFLSRTFCLWVASQLALESRRGFGCWIGHFGFLNWSCWLLKVASNTPNTRGGTWLIKWLNDQFPSLVGYNLHTMDWSNHVAEVGYLDCWSGRRSLYSFHAFHSRHSLGFLASRLLGLSGGFSASRLLSRACGFVGNKVCRNA